MSGRGRVGVCWGGGCGLCERVVAWWRILGVDGVVGDGLRGFGGVRVRRVAGWVQLLRR